MKKRVLSAIIVGALLFGIMGSQFVNETGIARERSSNSTIKSSESLKILALGNSFARDTLQYVYDVASSAGISDVSVGCLYIGGCS